MTKKEIQINDSFIVNALRNCGYNNYSAIADIIDNSIEPEVESSFVRVDFETEGTGVDKTIIKSILIIDDGVGMSMKTLDEAMALGSQTGKNGLDNLGMYGTGLKSASLSIGQILEVFTKTETSKLNYAKLSVEDAIASGEDIILSFDSFDENSEEWKLFNKHIKCGHGTIVKISKLDRLTNKNYRSFKGMLRNKIGEIFNKFIYSNVVKFYVGKNEVDYIDLMGGAIDPILMGDGCFVVEGHEIKYKAYFLPPCGVDSDTITENHAKKTNGAEYLERKTANQGMYIYRNNRLVGKALTLGLYQKEHWKTGFRCEVYMDGSCDYLFGSTFTKMVQEKTQDYMSQSLWDAMAMNINPFATEAQNRQRAYVKSKSENDPELAKETAEFYKKVADKQNKNMMLKANRRGENHKHEVEDDKEHKIRGKQTNPNPIKERTNKWLGGFEERPLGRNGEMYTIEHNANKPIIIINTDHAFYQKFYSTLDTEKKFIMAQIISCDEIAKQNVNYYNSEEIRNYIDCYNDTKSSEVMKSLSY